MQLHFTKTVSVLLAALVLTACATSAPKSSVSLNVAGGLGNPAAIKGKKLAVSGINVSEGVHLERLTLLSGEGHTGKKLASAALAGAFTMMGAGAGTDFASREPVEDHLSEADAKKMGDDIAKILNNALQASGLDMMDNKAVQALPAFAKSEGEKGLTKDTQFIKGKMFNPDLYLGYYNVPVAGFKYRSAGIFSGASSDDFAAAIQDATGSPLVLAWQVNVVNDRKVMRVRDLTLRCYGKREGWMGGNGKLLLSLSVNPDEISVPSGESHKNLEYWKALSPKFEEAAKAIAERLAFQISAK
jgi:hypothetical protein